MCTSPHGHQARYGGSLHDGHAHAEDHRRWSRRDFLSALGLSALGGTVALGGTPLQAFGRSPLSAPLQGDASDRILVLVQLDGGNDGLNTIVPVDDARYYNLRPTLAIPSAQTLSLATGLGLHPSLAPLMPYYQSGDMAMVQNVGYPVPDLSHFRSTDIWMSASDATAYDTTGWGGRYLETLYPNFEAEPPANPLAVQIGGNSMLFQAGAYNMGMSLVSAEVFESLAERGVVYETTGLSTTAQDQEAGFMRRIANDAYRYAGAIQTAAGAGQNAVAYPDGSELASHLAIVSRLIKGHLGSRIYLVTLGGFDTHSEQTDAHPALLATMAEAVAAFLQDLTSAGWDQNVLVMTFSEFGRTIHENGSSGTDHGTGAPLFLFGPGVAGGLYGSRPDLGTVDDVGNFYFETHFRSVYATVLQDWFGLAPSTVGTILGENPATLPFIADPVQSTTTEAHALPQAFTLHQNYPNPFNPTTRLAFTLDAPMAVRLSVYDVQGRRLRVLVDGRQPPGEHALTFDASGLPSGRYLYRLETPRGTRTRTMTLVR